MCIVQNCKTEKVIAKNYCQYHYDRLRRYGDLSTRPKELFCEDCSEKFSVRATGSLPVVCDSCATERHRTRQRKDRRRKGLWEYYKLTLSEYENMSAAVNGLCEICQKPPVGKGAKNNQLCVDHDHETGKIRGLLCTKCNTALGLLNDDQELMKIAIRYLKERNG